MRTPASIARHPIHPMLVPIPIGCWILSFACDLAFVLGAVLAAVPGIIDMLSLAGTPKKIALTHMGLNILIVLLYAMNFGMRVNGGAIAGLPLVFSIAGITLLAISGWLGGHMVYVHGVAVDDRQP